MLHMLLSSAETLYQVSTKPMLRRNKGVAVSAKLYFRILQNLSTSQSEEQNQYVSLAAEAAYTSLNKLDLVQNFHATIHLESTANKNMPIRFSANSSSAGLSYALALALEWRNQLDKNDKNLYDIFATGEIHRNGAVTKIDYLGKKIKAACFFMENKRNHTGALAPFIIFYPLGNQNEISKEIQNQVELLKGKLKPITQLHESLIELLGNTYDGNTNGRWSPFKGLKSFNYEDSSRFFGRDDVVNDLLASYQKSNGSLLVVTGVSGSGKSSVVKAGLIPVIKQGLVETKTLHWQVTTPKLHDSIKDLLIYLFQFVDKIWGLGNKPENLAKLALSTPESIFQQLNQVQKAENNKQLILFIDQYEEIFNHPKIPQETAEILAPILDKLSTKNIGLSIFISIKSEYLSFMMGRGFTSLVPQKLYPKSWKEIIEDQATYSGLYYEKGLAECIKNDAHDIPHALPVVEYLLEQLYNKATKRDKAAQELKQADYDRLGGLQGVITYRAKQSSRQYSNYLAIFFDYFVGINSEGLPFAKSVEITSLKKNKPTLYQLIQSFINSQLVIDCSNKSTRKVKLAHDSLFVQWKQLKEWLSNNKTYLKFRYLIEGQFTQWNEINEKDTFKKNNYLLQNKALLQQASEISKKNQFLNTQIKEYIDTSIEEANKQKNIEKERVKKGLHNLGIIFAERSVKADAEGKQMRSSLLSLAALEHLIPEKSPRIENNAFQIVNKTINTPALQMVHPSIKDGSVTCIAFSAKNTILASGGRDKKISLWNTVSGKISSILDGHTQNISSLSFSSDGNILASGSEEGIIHFWDIVSNKKLFTIKGYTNEEITGIAFSPDGKTLAFASEEWRKIHLWDIKNSKISSILEGHTSTVCCIDFSPDGKTLASGSYDKTIRLWDVFTGDTLSTFKEHSLAVKCISFSPDNQTLASGGQDKIVCLWDITTKSIKSIFKGHSAPISSIDFSPDGTQLASGSYDKTVYLWNLTNNKVLSVFERHTTEVLSIAFSPDGKTLASGSWDDTICLWDLTKNQGLPSVDGHEGLVRSITFSYDGMTLVSGSSDHTMRLWDVVSGKELSIFRGHTDGLTCVAISPDGKTLASGSYDKTIRLWDTWKGTLISIFHGHTDAISSISFSPDGQSLASGSEDKTIRIWSINSAKVLSVLEGHSKPIFSISFSPDGKTLASGGRDARIYLWDIKDRSVKCNLKGHSSQINSVTFSSSGKILASACMGRTIRLWDVEHYQPLYTLKGHDDLISDIAFSPDETQLASVAYDTTLRLWDITNGEILSVFEGHKKPITSVAFSSDGKLLASGSWDEMIRLWRADREVTTTPLQAKKKLDYLSREWSMGVQELDVILIKPTRSSVAHWSKNHPFHWISAAKNRDGQSMIELGNIYLRDNNIYQAKYWFEQAKTINKFKTVAEKRLLITNMIAAKNQLDNR